MTTPTRKAYAKGAGHATVLLSPNTSPAPKAPASLADDDDAAEAQPLVDLLTRASETIRAERARADALDVENTRLRAQLDGVRLAFLRAEAQRQHRTSKNAGAAARAARSKDDDDDDDGDDPLVTYVRDELCGRAEATAEDVSGGPLPPHRRPHRGSRVTEFPAASRAASREAVSAAEKAEASASDEAGRHADPRRSGSGLRSPRIEETVNLPVHAMACRLRRALAPRPSEAVLADVIHTMVGALQHDVLARLRHQQQSDPSLSDRGAASPLSRGFAMVRVRPCVYRLLLGPPAEVCRMAAASQSGSGAACGPAQRPAATPYRRHYLLYGAAAGDSSTARAAGVSDTLLHLTIDSGALCVSRGGGHVDLIEYLERRLHLRL